MSAHTGEIMVVYSGTHHTKLSSFVHSYFMQLKHVGIPVTSCNLDEADVRSCLGCYICNLRTPGICVIKDDQASILKSFITARKVVLVFPLVQGFMSASTKTFIDRLYPLELPFIKITNGTFTHDPRYPSNPKIGFIVHPERDTDREDLEINLEINRFIGDFYGGFSFQRTTEDTMEEIVNETICV